MKLFLAVLVLVSAVMHGALARASNSNNSSDGSGNSSRNSADSSRSSGDSSKNSSDSTGQSPQNSTDSTTQSREGKIISIAIAVVVVGTAVAGGTIGIYFSTRKKKKKETTEELSRFIKENHPVLVAELANAKGPLLDAWADAWGLNAGERRQVFAKLDGSKEQTRLLQVLNRPITAVEAEHFSFHVVQVLQNTLGQQRTQRIFDASANPSAAL